jgi:hypothetical protein
MTLDEQKKLNRIHILDPEVGDYWNEMLTPICVVLGRRPDAVLICETTKPTGPDHWTWDLSRVQWLELGEFAAKLTYGGGGDLRDTTWCNVRPKAHAWARDIARREMFGDDAIEPAQSTDKEPIA